MHLQPSDGSIPVPRPAARAIAAALARALARAVTLVAVVTGIVAVAAVGTSAGGTSCFPYPIGSMYAIYGNIYHQYTPNVSIHTIHGSYGIWCLIVVDTGFPYITSNLEDNYG